MTKFHLFSQDSVREIEETPQQKPQAKTPHLQDLGK